MTLENNSNPVRRPAGLKRAAQRAVSPAPNDDEKKQKLEVAIPEGEDIDEVEELVIIYLQALEKQAENDLTKAKALFQGTVHEADRLLRLEAEKKEEAKEFRPNFHLVMASALCDLSTLRQEEENAEVEKEEEYLQVALDRLESGLNSKETYDGIWELELVLVKILLNMAKVNMRTAFSGEEPPTDETISKALEKDSSLLKRATETLDKLVDTVTSNIQGYLTKSGIFLNFGQEVINSIQLVQQHVSSYDDWENFNKWSEWCKNKFELLTSKDEKLATCWLGLAKDQLAKAHFFFQNQDEETEEVSTDIPLNMDDIGSGLKEGLTHIEKALTITKENKDTYQDILGEIYLTKCEIEINLGNITEDMYEEDEEDNDEKENEFYIEAFKSFEFAVHHNNEKDIPEQLTEFFEEWKGEMNE